MIEGTVTFGCREFTTVETLAKICKHYKEKYPLVQIAIHTATADTIYEMMNKGLVDIALFMEPIDTEGFDYIRMKDSDHWVVGVTANCVIAWRRNIPYSQAVNKMIEEINAFQA